MNKIFAFPLLITIAASAAFCSGCARKQYSAPGQFATAAKTSAPAARAPIAPAPLAAEVNSAAGNSAALAEIRKSGILRAALDCSRPPLCYKDSYGVARGFEVDLLRQTASALGVKLNIVPAGADAAISGPFKLNPEKPDAGLIAYYYSAKTGWLALRVNGDAGLRDAVKLIWDHLYDTGTFQQLFLNRLQQPQASDIKAGRK
ncbi:MAG: transporter substrate-binding domain-containing protein [bacterium]